MVTRRNYSRHRQTHREPSATRLCRAVTASTSEMPRSRSTSRDTATSELSILERQTQSSPGGISVRRGTSPTHLLAEVTRALLEQHHLSTEHELQEFVRVRYPEIPEYERKALVVGTVVAAQRASSFHFVVERNKCSRDPAKQEMAMNAGSSLSFWNLGFQVPTRSRSHAVYQPEVAEVGAEDPFETCTMQPKDVGGESAIAGPSDLQLPVSLDQSRQDYDILEIAVRDAGLNEAAVQSASPPPTTFEVGALAGVSASSTTTSANVQRTPMVEPYIPVPVSSKPVPDMPYVPTAINEPPPASRVEEEEADLVISVDPEVEEDLTAGLPLSTQEQPSVKTAAREAISQGVARKERVPQKSKSQKESQPARRSDESQSVRPVETTTRPTARRQTPSSRSPPRRCEPRTSRERSPRRDRRQESPPRRLVLTGSQLRDYLEFERARSTVQPATKKPKK